MRTRRTSFRRWVLGVGLCAGLVALPLPGARARRAAEAATLEEYLELRARAAPPEADPARPLLAAQSTAAGPARRAAELCFGTAHGPGLRLDARIGPVPLDLLAELDAPPGALGAPNPSTSPGAAPEPTERSAPSPDPLAPIALLAGDEAAATAELTAALASALGVPVRSGAARGQSPLGHVALVERARNRRLTALVSVWNLANDLAETDVLRRVHARLAPDGPIDELCVALRDPARAARAQEAWLAARDDAAREVAAVLGGLGFELDRRARLHGARGLVVLLAPDPSDAAASPCSASVAAEVNEALCARGVRTVTIAGAAARRDPAGALTSQGVVALVAAVRAELERAADPD